MPTDLKQAALEMADGIASDFFDDTSGAYDSLVKQISVAILLAQSEVLEDTAQQITRLVRGVDFLRLEVPGLLHFKANTLRTAAKELSEEVG